MYNSYGRVIPETGVISKREKGNFMNKVTFNVDLCKGCGLCVTACPKKIISLDKTTLNKKGYHPAGITDASKCIACAFCATMCPDVVIKVEKLD